MGKHLLPVLILAIQDFEHTVSRAFDPSDIISVWLGSDQASPDKLVLLCSLLLGVFSSLSQR